jgi:hypothetical protein
MKTLAFRFIVGLITFTFSLSFVWISWTYNVKVCELISVKNQPIEIEQNKFWTSENGEIEIRFIGYGEKENRPTIILEIINHNSKSAKYRSFLKDSIYPFTRFNGKELQESRCGTGMTDFELKSGDSFTIETVLDIMVFGLLWKKGSFEFGYYFVPNGDIEGKQYWSEPIIISDEMKKEIIKKAPDFLRQI